MKSDGVLFTPCLDLSSFSFRKTYSTIEQKIIIAKNWTTPRPSPEEAVIEEVGITVASVTSIAGYTTAATGSNGS